MNNPLVALYETHVLGDGRGRLTPKAEANGHQSAEVPQESVAQKKKYHARLRAQRDAIARAIAEFRALDDD